MMASHSRYVFSASSGLLVLFSSLVFGLSSCDEGTPPAPLPAFLDGTFIVCEGVFGTGNGQLDFYGRNNDMQSAVYAAANNGLPIGDLPQSMAAADDTYWLVVNNAGKVVGIDPQEGTETRVIEGLTSPRYLLPVGDDKAYVSDLFAGSLQVVNLATASVTASIPGTGWSERMVYNPITQRVFVADMTQNQIRILDVLTDQWVDSLPTGLEPEGLLQDTDQSLWVLCTGGFSVEPPSLLHLDPSNGVSLGSWTLGSVDDYPSDLVSNGDFSVFYWLGSGGIYRMASDAPTGPSSPWIPADGRALYALGCDAQTGDVYVSDAVDYASAGQVYRYSADGTLLDDFTTGINPGAFFFIP